jgi:outer membrane protein assembly factor BamB
VIHGLCYRARVSRSPVPLLLLTVVACSTSTSARTDGGPHDGGPHDSGAHDGPSEVRPPGDGGPDGAPQPGGPAVAFQIDIAHSGNQTASTLTPPLTRAWSVDFGDSAAFVSYPLIVDGRVFVTGSTPNGAVASLRALDLATGNVIWGPVDIGGVDEWSNAAYGDGRLYVLVATGLLTAFDPATGAAIWSTQLPGQSDFSSPPTAAGGMVYAAGFGLDGTVYGVDGSTGTVVWTAPVLGGDACSPALSADAVFVSYACTQAYAFSRTDGTPIWYHDGPCVGAGGATAALWQGRLWTRDTSSNNLVLDTTSGAELGSFSASVIPAFAGQRGFFLSGDTLQALDITTRAILWGFTGDGALASAPLVVNGVVYIGSTSGQLYGLDPATGAVLWSDTLPWGVSPSAEAGLAPVAGLGAGGNALVVPAGNHLVCYR